MSRRRRFLIFTAAAALLLAAGYGYWAWDPVDVTRYVGRDSVIVLETEDLMRGLDNIRYTQIAGLLPEPIRQAALAPYRSIGPGLNWMDMIGRRFAVFVPEGAAETIPRGAVVCTRISQRAKLAETLASLVGRTHRIRSPAGADVRMVKIEGYSERLFYARIDRILVISDSLDSLDAALGTPPVPFVPSREDRPSVTLRATGEGIVSVLKVISANASGKRDLIRNMRKHADLITKFEIKISLAEDPSLQGQIALVGDGIVARMYRNDYRAYAPRGFDAVPGQIVAALSTNSPDLAEDVAIGTPDVNRLFHVASDFFGDLGSFDGEFALARARLGGAIECFLSISTNRLLFPGGMIDDLLARLRRKIGETTYMGEEEGGRLYRIMPARSNCVPAFAWISRDTILLCSSEKALDAFFARRRLGSGGMFTFGEGDLFLVADPRADAEAFLGIFPLCDRSYLPLLNSIGPVSLEATVTRDGKIRFSGTLGKF